MKPHLMTSARPSDGARAPEAFLEKPDRRSPPSAGGTHRPGSSRRADRRRSCRRRTRRPTRAAWSGTPRRRRRAGRSPPRTRRGRWWRRRRCRPRAARRSNIPGRQPLAGAGDLVHGLAGLAGRKVAARHARNAARDRRHQCGSTRGERFARSPSTSRATPVIDGPSAAIRTSAAASASIPPIRIVVAPLPELERRRRSRGHLRGRRMAPRWAHR